MLKKFKLSFHKPFDKSFDRGRANERNRRLALTAFTAAIRKVFQMAVPLITLPITYNYLDSEVYGLWAAITQFFGLFSFSDLGLGHGLHTKLSQASGKDDLLLCRKIITNTFSILLCVAVLLLAVFWVIFPIVDWASLMNASKPETIGLSAAIVVAIVLPKLLDIPVAIIQRTQYALQEGFRNDAWNIIGAILSLISVIVIAKCDFGKLLLIAVSALIPVLVSVANMTYFFGIRRKDLRISFALLDWGVSRDLLRLGLKFCILMVLIAIGNTMDSFIVAKTCSLTDAGSYNVIYRVSAVCSAIVAVLGTPLWGANGDAIARGEIEWVRKNTRRMALIMTAMAVVFSIVVMLSAKFVMKIWMGEDFTFSYHALLWLCLMQIQFSFVSPYAMALNAYGIVGKQVVLYVIYTPVVFVLKYLLSQKFGVAAVPSVGSVFFLFVICIPIYIATNNYLKKASI